ncbi:ribbon-helix-helix domain-containing protein [Acinetobacter sp. YH12140]|nr:ribbon-helix-helix domain-containing protein [Acinetobacter sp. YH12140]
MQEALNLGFLDINGKKTDSTSVRMTHEALQAIDALAAMDDVKRSEWIRDAAIEKLMKFKKQHEYLSKAFGNTTNTVNTSCENEKSPVARTTEPLCK